MGIWLAIDHPDHINRGNKDVPIVVPTPEELEAVESNRKTAANGLYMFQINTPGMKEETSLNHMVDIRKQMYHDKRKENKVSDAVHIRSPTKKHKRRTLCAWTTNECLRATLWQM